MHYIYVAKYRNNYCISTPLFPSFLHHHCLQILYTTNFLRVNVFYIIHFFTSSILTTGPYVCMTKSSCYSLATQCLHLCYICSCSTSNLARQALCTVADTRFFSGSAQCTLLNIRLFTNDVDPNCNSAHHSIHAPSLNRSAVCIVSTFGSSLSFPWRHFDNAS